MPGSILFLLMGIGSLIRAQVGLTAESTSTLSPSERERSRLEAAVDAGLPLAERIQAVRRLGRISYELSAPVLLGILDGEEPEAVRRAALLALEQRADPRSVDPLLQRWAGFAPGLRQDLMHALTTRPALTGAFVAQLEAGSFPLEEVDTATRQRLKSFPDAALAARAGRLLSREPLMNVRAVFERFRPALDRTGDARRGREVFRQRSCVNCHRLSGEGVFVGADLFTVKDTPKAELLQSIVAPNLFFMPNFQLFVAETAEGEIEEGLMAGANSEFVTLRRALGEDTVLRRRDLRSLKGMNVSLMPEGLLEGLDDGQVADLLEFIRQGH